MKKISFVIPTYNSEGTIEQVVKSINDQIKSIHEISDYEIILVNDASNDNTLRVCKQICKENRFVKLINFSKNFGQHSAIMAGLRQTKGDYIVCLDDDMQTPPSEIYKLIKTIDENEFDVVYAKYNKKQHSFFRNIGSYVNDFMAEILIKKPKDIKLSSFFLAKKFVIKEILKYDNAYPYIAGLIFRVTQNIGNVLVEHKEREVGSSNYNLVKLTKLWINGFTNFSVKPLRVASITGFFFSIISFIWIIIIIFRKIFTSYVELGWTSLMVSIAFFGGIQLISIGLLGEYIGRIYLCINKTPQYVIKETYNIEGNEDENQ